MRLIWRFARHSLFLFLWQFYLFIIFATIGNFGFGIDEHIDLGIKYDTSTGIFGMDFTIVLKRPGDRVAHRRARKNRVGKFQRVHMDDAKLWFIEELGGTILNWVVPSEYLIILLPVLKWEVDQGCCLLKSPAFGHDRAHHIWLLKLPCGLRFLVAQRPALIDFTLSTGNYVTLLSAWPHFAFLTPFQLLSASAMLFFLAKAAVVNTIIPLLT